MKSIETYRDIGSYELANITQKEPSVFNGMVRIRRTVVTVEVVEEPHEVLEARLNELYKNEKNHHNIAAIMAYAKKHGYKLEER